MFILRSKKDQKIQSKQKGGGNKDKNRNNETENKQEINTAQNLVFKKLNNLINSQKG